MLATIKHHANVNAKIIAAIERGQTPPWRRPISDRENDGFPTHPRTLVPFRGVNVLLLNTSATEQGFRSRFWGTEAEWAKLDSQVTGHPTILCGGTPVYNADQTVLSLGSVAYRSRKRPTPAAVDYKPAETVIAACQKHGADIRHVLGMEAAYYFPPNDFIVFPLKEQFVQGPGGLEAYYDSLFHELAHFSEPRLGWEGPSDIRELRAEIAAPFLTAQIGIPVLTDMKKLTNHRKHLARWVRAMQADSTLIVNVAADASRAVRHLLSFRD